MDAKEYRAKARAYVAKEGRKTPTEIYKAIGQPPTGYRLKADGRGSVTTESTTNRRGRKTRAEGKRQEALRLRPPQTKEEENLRRRQNYKRTSIRQKGGSVVIDHKIDLSLLQSTVEGLPPEQAKARIEQLEKSYGPLGDRPQNRQIIGEYTNELKRQQTKAVQSKLRSMEAKQPSRRVTITPVNFGGGARLMFNAEFDPTPDPGTRRGGGVEVSDPGGLMPFPIMLP